MKVNGKRAVLAVRAALDDAGLNRTSGYSGGEIAGWIDPNHFGSTGFSVRRQADGNLSWHVVISGKPHLRYREWTERRDGDSIDLHEPVNPETLAPRIKAAFETLGMDIREVSYGGAQMHWDDDVSYNVVTDHPEWLGPPDRTNAARDGDGVLIKTMSFGQRAPEVLASMQGLVGYVQGNRAYLTRESLSAVEDKAAKDEASRQESLAHWGEKNAPNYLKLKGMQVSLADTGEFVFASPGHPQTRVAPETVTNHWGDEVEVWKVPSYWVKPGSSFEPTVPFLLDGEMRKTAPFRLVDAQNGGDAPWLDQEPSGPAPR